MSEKIETTEDTIKTPIGTWAYASIFLLRKYQIEDIGANQYVLSEWLKNNNLDKIDNLGCIMPETIIIPKDKFNVLRIIGIRLFGANNFGLYYINHATVLNIELMGTGEYRNRLIDYINQCSYNQYKFYMGGLLCKAEEKNHKGSKLYSAILEKGVKDINTRIKVFIEPSGFVEITGEDINQQYGGAVTYRGKDNRSLILVYITGKNAMADDNLRDKPDLWSVPPALALMHELAAHAIPQGLEGLDELNALEIENKIRTELHTTLRKQNDWHTVAF